MASISNPVGPKKSKLSWFFPVFILMLVGFPFMQFSFSPLPVLSESSTCTDAAVYLDGSKEAQQTISAEQLAELLTKCPRDRRPLDKKQNGEESTRVVFTVQPNEEGAAEQQYTLRFYQNELDGTPTGFLDIGKFSYRISNPALLETNLRALVQPATDAAL